MRSGRVKELVAFGRVVRRRRANLNLTQEALSFRARLHRTYIAHIERGGRNVSLVNILRLAEALETTPDVLLRDLRLFLRD